MLRRLLSSLTVLFLLLSGSGNSVSLSQIETHNTQTSNGLQVDFVDYHTDIARYFGSNSASAQSGQSIAGETIQIIRNTVMQNTNAVAAGIGHTCALTSGGGVKCWGNNAVGQLGDGTTVDRPTSVDVSGLSSGVTAVAAGGYHTCALTSAGGVKCWGANRYGQLGDGTSVDRLTPVDVSGLTSGVSAVAAGGWHTCALTSAGGIKCWGNNAGGQLGDGTTVDRTTPVDVSGLTSGVTAVAVGSNHTCALISGGGVKCWGGNYYGQLGIGVLGYSVTPVDVVGFGGDNYYVSGNVSDINGGPIPGVTISDGASHTTTTDSNGNYTLTGLTIGTYTITPSNNGYAFSPPSRTISVPPDALNQNFTGTSGPDFTVTAIEVTQAIQDLENSVPFINNKGTYARVHVRNLGEPSSTLISAQLCNLDQCLTPNNMHSRIPILNYPERSNLDHSFYFELPPSWLRSDITLVAEVNPKGLLYVPEKNSDNNTLDKTVSFIVGLPIRIKLFGVQYRTWPLIWHIHEPREVDYDLVVSWLRRAYPTAEISWSRETIEFGLGLPTCIDVNERFLGLWAFDRISGEIESDTRYYGLVSDTGGFMRGCSLGTVGSGPTGIPDDIFTWDNDESYGDWYAGHELAHTYGRYHANFCGANTFNRPYPYPDGIIGGPITDTRRFFGFDIQTQSIYTPTDWHDVMTYCEYQWISDFTYTGILDYLQASVAQSVQSESSAGEHLVISGLVNYTMETIELGTIYRLQDVLSPALQISGTHHIKLKDHNNFVLADYPFTPHRNVDTLANEDVIGLISETVPWITGTQHIGVYSGTLQLASQSISDNNPSVNLISPNGGEVFTNTAVVTWDASDADEDPLAYVLQYTHNDGETWQAIDIEITNTDVYTLDLTLLPGGDQSMLRVLASDGINTALDTSADTFSVLSKPPEARILSPSTGSSYLPGQTIVLVGEGMDVEDGILGDAALRWQSDISGVIGFGKMIDATSIVPGYHNITLTAMDSDLHSSNDSANIFIGYMIYLPMTIR